MNTKLNYIQDWLPLAKQAKWSVARLAKLNGITERTLRRHFIKRTGKTPKDWLAEQRQKLAISLLLNGTSVKETASAICYQHAQSFSRAFKRRSGRCPLNLPSIPRKGKINEAVR